MEAQTSENQPPPRNGPPNQRKKPKRKQPQHSADIVFTKGSSIHTMPSLSKILKGITDSIIGLQYVWEYRSPSKSVPPHYQCKLCALSRLQHDMIDHVKGWKHGFRYMKKAHPYKIVCEEEDAIKDPALRKTVKAAVAEVEKTEGRGQIRVILKEPFEVHAFKGLRSAAPRPGPPPGPGMGLMGPPLGPRFPDSRFPGEFPPYGGPVGDYPPGEYGEPGFGGYLPGEDFTDPGIDQGPYPDGMGHHQPGDSNGFGPGSGRDDFGGSGLLDEGPSKMYSNDYQGNQRRDSFVDKPSDRPGLMGAAPGSSSSSSSSSSSLPSTLLTYLDSFRIENEGDAQLVLKVTQKLTDVLMEYRLRSVSKVPSFKSLPVSSTSFSSTTSRFSSSGDQYSNSLPGPSRYSDGPSRYYK